jgi:hypothetical protein
MREETEQLCQRGGIGVAYTAHSTLGHSNMQIALGAKGLDVDAKVASELWASCGRDDLLAPGSA